MFLIIDNMAQAYNIGPDDMGWGKINDPNIEATHSRKLPGVQCPICGAWATTGIIYPSVDISLLGKMLMSSKQWPIPLEEFKKLATDIQSIIGAERPIEPGADLGPLRGKANGKFGDFAWVNPWTPLLRKSVYLSLKGDGVDLVGVQAELDFTVHAHEPFFELEALPKLKLVESLLSERCEMCGRLPITSPEKVIVSVASYDESLPIQRIAHLPTMLVVNEMFANLVREKNLKNVVLRPIELR